MAAGSISQRLAQFRRGLLGRLAAEPPIRIFARAVLKHLRVSVNTRARWELNEFNEESSTVKIDRWYGVKSGRPFPERAFLDKLFVAHDLEAGSAVVLDREIRRLG
jgi:hypothetical protein